MITTMRFYIKLLLSLFSAGLLITSFYDNFSFLVWFALIPYFLLISSCNLRWSVFFSWLTGIFFFAGVTYWFTAYSFVFWFPILGIMSISFIVFGIAFYFVYSKIKSPVLRVMLISSIWAAVEFFRHRTFLAFPWGVLGYSQHNYLPVMQISKLTGILGVSILVVLFNLCVTELLISRKTKIKVIIPAICIAAAVIVNFTAGGAYLFLGGGKYSSLHGSNSQSSNAGSYAGNRINVALVQPNITFEAKFDTDTDVLIPQKTGAAGKYFKAGTELVVFPESVIWGAIERDKNKSFYEWVKNTAKNENLYFIMGQILWDEQENYYNAVQLYTPDLQILGRYNKMHPLPCAEYMPYPKALGFLSFMNIAKLNITPVKQFVLIDYPGKGKIGANICFESTLPIISRTFRKMGEDVLFTFTDTAGFKDSEAARYHLVFSQVRAIENNSFMVHSGNNGISAIIDSNGKILVQTSLVKKEVIYGTVYLNTNKSFYSRFGELIIYIYFALTFIYLLVYIIQRKRDRR
jgi:apolipoprotein N-acyltransferase